jgi:MSHA biogenesis protein MshM
MYLEHFGLREVPFSITPHTEFFFSGANRGATLDALVYAITHDEGIVKVTGEVGSGKTMLCRMLLEKLPPHIATVYLANPSLSRDEMLYALADELALPDPPARVHQLLRALQGHLVRLYGEGRQVVVLIDEAHAMPAESLEEVRLLSNLESNRHKLLKIVLFGQPELDALLARNEMRQLRERITHNFGLEPLTQTDIGSYLMFRMRAAGYAGPDLFTTGAVRLVAEASLGLSRRINILADKALLAAFVDGERQVGVKQVRTAITDASFGRLPGGTAAGRRWLTAATVTLAIGLVAAATWALRLPVADGEAAAPAQPAAALPAATTATAAGPEAGPPAAGGSDSTPPSPPAAEPGNGAPAGPIAMVGAPPTAAHPQAGTAAEAPLPLQASVELSAAPAPRPRASLLEDRHSAFEAWVASAPAQHYFIQLLRTNTQKREDIERYLQQVAALVDREQLRVYRSHAGGQDWLGVIYGDFATREAAMAALARLPEELRDAGAYPRTVGMLK